MLRTRKEPLIYSDNFRKAVIDEYKDNSMIKELLDKNDYFLGRCLNDGMYSSIHHETIIKTLESGKQDELLKQAYHIKHLVELYEMWGKEVFLD